MEKLFVGYGRVDCTPEYTVSLAGYGNLKRRINENTIDPLYVSCVAVSDSADTTVLLFSVDAEELPSEFIHPIREKLGKELGIPAHHIIVNVSHSHSTPVLTKSPGAHGAEAYRAQMEKAILEAGKAAFADRAEAKMFTLAGDIEDLNFVKHYKMSNGTVAGDNHGNFKHATILGHATETDKQVRFVKFTRQGKKDILLWNWQGHPLTTGGINKTDLSADYPGAVRAILEKEDPDVYVSFLQGCGGDLNTRSNIPEENPPQEYQAFGQLLAAQLQTLLQQEMTPVEAGPVKVVSQEFMGQVNHLYDHLADAAADITKYFAETGDRVTANKMAWKLGFASVYHAGFVRMRAGLGERLPLEMFAFSIGDVAAVTAPNETFHKIGENVRAESPFGFTLTLGYTNGKRSYLPTMEAFAYGCYEADVCRFVPGIGEVVEKLQLGLLQELKE